MTTRTLSEIAEDIADDWAPMRAPIPDDPWGFGAGTHPARPYLDAMRSLGQVSDHYGADTGESIVLYFLSNARTWRGRRAQQVKAELKRMLAGAR